MAEGTVETKIGGITHQATWRTEKNMIYVTYGAATKPAQLGGSHKNPETLARIILSEMVRESRG